MSKVALVAPVAVVVATSLVVLRMHFQPPTVPEYHVVTGGDGAGEVAVARGGRFDIELAPGSPVEGAVAARGFLLRGQTVRPWDPPFAVAADGTIRIAGPVDTLFAGVPEGAWEVAVAVGRPETLPTAPNDVLRARNRSPDGGPDPRAVSWRLVHERVRLGP